MSDETSGTVAGRGARRRASAGRLYKQRDSKTGKLLDPWWIDYSIRGRRYRESSKTTVRAEAVKLLRQRLGEHGSGRYAPNAERVTLNQLVEGLRVHYRLKGNRSLDRAERALAKVVAHFGGGALAVDLTADRLEKYADTRQEKVAKATCKYELACLRKAMTAAVKNGLLVLRPVFPDINPKNTRQGFFERADLDRVLAELPEPLRGPTRFAAITGWRKSEVLGLEWSRVDFGAGVIRLEPDTTKNDDGRTFPFARHPELAELLRERSEHKKAVERRTGAIVRWVFHRAGRRINSMDTAWRSACRRAGCPGRIFHDLRRTAVRALERAGVARSVATKLTGHKTEAVYRRYAIVSESDLGDGVAKLARAEAAPSAPITPVISLRAAAQ